MKWDIPQRASSLQGIKQLQVSYLDTVSDENIYSRFSLFAFTFSRALKSIFCLI